MENLRKKIALLLFFIFAFVIIITGIISCAYNINSSTSESTAPHSQRISSFDNNNANSDSVASINLASNASPVIDELKISNIIIFIYFADEEYPSITQQTIYKFTGTDNSLHDYFYKISYGKIIISTYYAGDENTAYYAYKSNNSRSYYAAIKDKDIRRSAYEGELLTNAISGFNQAMDFSEDIIVDQDGDGYVDCVSFVISGGYENITENWGALLWPHSCRMSVLEKPSVKINDKIVEYYTFNFLENLTTGLNCHEFAHVLGTPDLYHYYKDTNYYQIGNWDLMHFECATPQYMTTYMRYKYLGARSVSLSNIYVEKISQITQSGTFSLKPVTVVGKDDNDFLAYKIEINDYESIWIEYRNKDVVTYDNSIPGNGLIVYRVNSKASLGNQNGRYRDTLYPDEVYVYRPNFSRQSATKDKEDENLKGAYLSQNNPKFNILGVNNTTTLYDDKSIYLTNGKNTGIIITPQIQTDEEITFNITLPDNLSSTNQVEKVEVLDKIKYEASQIKDNNIIISYGGNLLSKLSEAVKIIITYKNGDTLIATMDNCKFVFDSGKVGVTQQATVRYSDSYNTNIVGYFNLLIKDENFSAIINAYPAKLSYNLGEELDLTGLILSLAYASGVKKIVSYVDYPLCFTYIGYDKTVSGDYKVEVFYQDETGNKDKVIIPVSVIADLEEIQINKRNSKQLVTFSSTGIYQTDYENIMKALPSLIEVRGKLSDGVYRILGSNSYEICPFNYSGANKSYNIKVKLISDPNIESIEGYNIAFVDKYLAESGTVEISKLPKLTYKYGESLDLTAGELLIKFDEVHSYNISMEGFHNEFNAVYKCVTTGMQNLTAKIYGKDITLSIKVGTDTTQLLSSNNENVYVNGKAYAQALSSIKLSEFIASIASPFIIKVFYNDMYINPNAYRDMLISDNIKIHLFNNDNAQVAVIPVSLLGDTNSDGLLDRNDIDELAFAVVTAKYRNNNYDINKDGVYDIVDFVLLMERIRK